MKHIIRTHRLVDRFIALLSQLFIRHTVTDKFRILYKDYQSAEEHERYSI
jgi:hypothetical protein